MSKPKGAHRNNPKTIKILFSYQEIPTAFLEAWVEEDTSHMYPKSKLSRHSRQLEILYSSDHLLRIHLKLSGSLNPTRRQFQKSWIKETQYNSLLVYVLIIFFNSRPQQKSVVICKKRFFLGQIFRLSFHLGRIV